MDLRRFIEEKWVRNGKICHFWAEPAKGYWYPKLVLVPIVQRDVVPVPKIWVPVPIDSEGLVLVPIKVVPVPMLPATLFLRTLHY